MPGRKYNTEQFIRKLRRAEVLLAEGATVAEVCKALEVNKQTYYRWRREYSGMEVSQARRQKEL
jgi:putative transposase